MRSRELIYAHYDKAFERRGRFENQGRSPRPLQKPWLPENKSAAILDFACGIGETLQALRAAGYTNLSGVDATRVQYERARKALPNDINLTLMDGRDFIKLHVNEYDLIVAYDIVEHFTKDEAVELCQDFHRALKPGGILVIKFQNSASILGLFGRDVDFTHLASYTEFSLYQLLDATGFVDHQLVEKDTSTNLRLWRPWRPFTGLGFRPRLNILLHKIVYWLAGTRPPKCFELLLEAWTHKPNLRTENESK